MDLFETSTPGLQPLSIMFGQQLATQFKQVSILHLMQLKPIFHQIVANHAQCLIQLKTTVSALHRFSNEHKIFLGCGKDKMIIMKAGVHLMNAAESR